ncbi:MAG: hypothetical protein OXC26_19480 [Albidovulum sp.]|nr:hypothetical protein [Albidovulum sp.]
MRRTERELADLSILRRRRELEAEIKAARESLEILQLELKALPAAMPAGREDAALASHRGLEPLLRPRRAEGAGGMAEGRAGIGGGPRDPELGPGRPYRHGRRAGCGARARGDLRTGARGAAG